MTKVINSITKEINSDVSMIFITHKDSSELQKRYWGTEVSCGRSKQQILSLISQTVDDLSTLRTINEENKVILMNINCLELMAPFYALKSFSKDLKNTHIQLKLYNTSTLH